MFSIKYTLKYFICVLIIGLGSSDILPSNDPFNENNTYPDLISSVHFELIEGLILIKASLDGKEGNFILDTGTPSLILNQKVDKGDFIVWTAKGDQPSCQLNLKNFECGNIIKKQLEGWSLDLSHVETLIKKPLLGIIGSDLIMNHRLLIDYENNEILLLPKEVKKVGFDLNNYDISHIPFDIEKGHMPIVTLEVADQNKRLVFDTGAGISVLHSNERDKKESRVEKYDINIRNTLIQDVNFKTQSLSDLRDLSNYQLDGILSVSSLNSSKVIIDYTNSRISCFWKKV